MKIVLSLFTIFALISVLHADNRVIDDIAHTDVMTIGGEVVDSATANMPSTVSSEVFESVPVESVQVNSDVVDEGENVSYYYEGSDVEIYPIESSSVVPQEGSVVESRDSLEGVESGYYVQIIAFSKSTPDAVISKLESKGFNNYKFQNVGEITKLIVGPYPTRKAAAKVLKKLKRVRRDAFIYQQ